MSALVVFDFDGFAVRTVVIDGKPLFVGRDVATALGYADATNALKQHCRGVAIHHPIADAMGRSQMTRVIGEPDLLRMIANSRLPQAERFERWAFEDVLPTVLRTGSYVAPMSEDEIVHQALAITARRVQVLETRVAELEPVAAHAETFRQADGLRTIGDVANDFKAHCAENFPGVKDTDDNVEPVDDFAPLTADMHISVSERTEPAIVGPIVTDRRSVWPLAPWRMTLVVVALLGAAVCGPPAADPSTGFNGADLGVLISLATFAAAFLIRIPKKGDQP